MCKMKGHEVNLDLTCSKTGIMRRHLTKGMNLTIIITFEFAEKDKMPGIENFFIIL